MYELVASETFVIMYDMRFFLGCSEGFRRLSILLAIAAFLVVIGQGVLRDIDARNGLISLCVAVHTQDVDNCEHGVGNLGVEACKANAEAEYTKCFSGAGSHPAGETLLMIGFYLLCGLAAAYLTAFVIRSVGWAVQGFYTHG